MHVWIATLIPAVLLAALVGSGCAPEEEGDLGGRSGPGGSGGGSGGGTVFNTNWVDDAKLPELRQPMGTSHHGVMIKRIRLQSGVEIQSFEVVDGDIVAVDVDEVVHSGDALVGSLWTLGGPLTPHPEPMQLAAREVRDGIPYYRFRDGGETLWISTCISPNSNASLDARLLSGFTLDELSGRITPLADTTYIACTNGATGKAAAWGYYDLAVALADFAPLELAIRVIRADYCYDGVAHTHPGVPLHIEDVWGVLNEDSGEVEAVWGPDGLLCRGQGRVDEIPGACGLWGDEIKACPEDFDPEDFPEARFITRLPDSPPLYDAK